MASDGRRAHLARCPRRAAAPDSGALVLLPLPLLVDPVPSSWFASPRAVLSRKVARRRSRSLGNLYPHPSPSPQAPVMLSALPASPATMSTFGADGTAAPDPALLEENRWCPGCKKSVIDENGGVVVAFGCVLRPFFPLSSRPFPSVGSVSLLPLWIVPVPSILSASASFRFPSSVKLMSLVHQPILLPCRLLQVRQVQQPGHC